MSAAVRAYFRIAVPVQASAALGVALFYNLPLFWGGSCAPPSIPEGLLIILVPALPVKALVAWAQAAYLARRGAATLARRPGAAGWMLFLLLFYCIDLSISAILCVLLFPVLVLLMFFYAVVPATFLLFPCSLVSGPLIARRIRNRAGGERTRIHPGGKLP